MLFITWFKESIGWIHQSNRRKFYIIIFVKLLFIIAYYSVSRCQVSICWSIRSTPCFVLTLPEQKKRVSNMIGLFKKYANLNLRPYYGVNGKTLYDNAEGQRLLPGEIGLRESMKKIYMMAIEKNYNEMFVFEDDAIPHRNFTKLFENLPERCREADVLLLGALVFYASRKRWPFGPCFDADHRTYGGHGLYVKKSAFRPIVDWLVETDIGPYDTVYQHLQKQGLKVRVAHSPFLVIQNLNHPSSVHGYRSIDRLSIDQRANVHNWNLEDYPTSLAST
ncbi:hypothetical protein I4U23_023164 [Adineta vaga]|nr:hypothetical protein I4U23_023164 [Adineta vaga]